MTLTFEVDLDSVKVSQHTIYHMTVSSQLYRFFLIFAVFLVQCGRL